MKLHIITRLDKYQLNRPKILEYGQNKQKKQSILGNGKRHFGDTLNHNKKLKNRQAELYFYTVLST